MAKQTQLNFIPGHSAPRSWSRLNGWDALLAAAVAALVLAFVWRSMSVTRHAWDWAALVLLKGLFATLRLGFWSLLVALVTGGLVGALSARQRGLAALPAVLYITVLRNTPPLVLLFLVYFFAGSFFSEPFLYLEDTVAAMPAWAQSLITALFAPQGQMDRMAAAVLTLGVYSGAYVAEIVRGALEAVDRTQWDASASLGMNPWQQMRWVIAPQAFRLMLPPLTGQCISVFKETALASAISLPELTFQSLEVMAVTRITYELWFITALLYLGLSLFWSRLGAWLEHRQKWRPVE